MKALNDMNNVERGYLLAKLFPQNLKDLTVFVQQEAERFREQEEYIRSIWAKRTFLTADYWFSLVNNTEQVLKRYNVTLHVAHGYFLTNFLTVTMPYF